MNNIVQILLGKWSYTGVGKSGLRVIYNSTNSVVFITNSCLDALYSNSLLYTPVIVRHKDSEILTVRSQ